MEKTIAHDQIPAELVKQGSKQRKMVIYKIIFKIWGEGVEGRGHTTGVGIWHNLCT
jgi:hypothetical protein